MSFTDKPFKNLTITQFSTPSTPSKIWLALTLTAITALVIHVAILNFTSDGLMRHTTRLSLRHLTFIPRNFQHTPANLNIYKCKINLVNSREVLNYFVVMPPSNRKFN